MEHWDDGLGSPFAHRRSSRDAAQGILLGAMLGAMGWAAIAGGLWLCVHG
jgi:hypothetical protein